MSRNMSTRSVRIEALERRALLSFTGGFSPPVHTPLGPATLLASGDFDADGFNDLIVHSGTNATTAPSARIHRGLGSGRFATTGVPIYSGPNVSAIAVGDFNNDAKLDVAFANDQTNGTVTVMFGRGDGTFGGPGSLPVIISPFAGANPKSIAVGDFNGDGNLDMLVGNAGRWSTATSIPPSYGPGLLLGTGQGTFQPVRQIRLIEPHTHIAVGDLDNDGNLDAVLAGVDTLTLIPLPVSAMHILRGQGDGSFAVSRSFLFHFHVRGLSMADLNGDGRSDLAALQVQPSTTATNGPATVFTFLANESATLVLNSSRATGLVRAAGLSAADFDDDGTTDFAVAGVAATAASPSPTLGAVSVLRGQPNGTLGSPRLFRTVGPPLAQLTADVNGDARMDIVTGSPSGASALLNTILSDSELSTQPSREMIDELA